MAQRRGYKFTNKRHSDKAVMSTVFGGISLLSLVTVIYLAYGRAGEAPISYGFSGILILIFAVAGLVLGVLAVREKDRFQLFGRLGCVLNTLALLGLGISLTSGTHRGQGVTEKHCFS